MEFPMKSSENLHLILETKFGDNPLVVGNKAILKTDVTKKKKHTKFSENQLFLDPWYAHVSISRGQEMFVFKG